MLPAPTTTITLPDGRRLAADDVGDHHGGPVLYLHGSPDSRLARHPDDTIAERLGLRLLALDRPGYGGTDPLPDGEGVLAWAHDVAVLLDGLGIERCRVAAWSAGSTWAFGLAAQLGPRVDRVVCFGAVAIAEDLDDEAVRTASAGRLYLLDELAAGRPVDEVVAELEAMALPPRPVDLDVARELLLDQYPPRSRAAVESVPGLVDQLATSLAAAVAEHGTAGVRADLTVQSAPGMAAVLDDVHQRVVLVAGTSDATAGVAASRSLAARLRDAEVVEWSTGHQGLLLEWQRWLELVAAP